MGLQGTRIVTACSDRTCRIWDAHSGKCLQTLGRQKEEVFNAVFNYDGQLLLTGVYCVACCFGSSLALSWQLVKTTRAVFGKRKVTEIGHWVKARRSLPKQQLQMSPIQILCAPQSCLNPGRFHLPRRLCG